MDIEGQRLFDDWKNRANGVGLIGAAKMAGAKLKRKTGTEVAGPCVYCGGTDRFIINLSKGAWHCRGAKGGYDAISLYMHAMNVTFMQACESLTGESPPRGVAKPLSQEELDRRESSLRARMAAEASREAAERDRRERQSETADGIWAASGHLAGSAAERYLLLRGIPIPPTGWPKVLRCHPGLQYPFSNNLPPFPCLIARVDDSAGELTAIWRVFLTEEGKKAPVEKVKLGLGPSAGGAVRIGGTGPKVGFAEGIESAMGAWSLISYRYPVWATLSTSGMVSVEVPYPIEGVTIFADGDDPVKRVEGVYVPDKLPPGLKAARSLRDRLTASEIRCGMGQLPPPGSDYLDLWNSSRMHG